MAEPLSFVSSVIAVAALAEGVVTRGYRYLKAVKNCADEVRNLMAETNVLCGILGRLRVLLADNRSKSEATVKSKENAGQDLNDDDEISDEVDVVSSEDEVIQTFDYGSCKSPIVSAMFATTYALASASSSRLHLSMPEHST